MTEPRGRTYIALGTNLPFEGLAGPALLSAALKSIADAGVNVLQRSSFWISPPWPADLKDQPPYVNAVTEIDPGALEPPALFALLTKIEAAFGRERRARWAARTLDLDIIDYQGWVCGFGPLSVPHARITQRAFVLAPLAELAPDWRHPATGQGAGAMLALLADREGPRRLVD